MPALRAVPAADFECYMKKNIITLLTLMLIFPAGYLWAEVSFMSPSELANKSNLVIIGEVKDIKQIENQKKYAIVDIKEVLKGKNVSSIKVKFDINPNTEQDVGDANIEQDNPILFYLETDKEDKNYYRVVHGWSGIVRFYEGAYYHQYWKIEFDKYIEQLKEDIKNKND